MQKFFFLIFFLIFLCYELSVCPLLLRFIIAKPSKQGLYSSYIDIGNGSNSEVIHIWNYYLYSFEMSDRVSGDSITPVKTFLDEA